MMRLQRLGLLAPLGATICNLLMAYAVYFLARVAFLVVNYSFFGENLTWSHLLEMMGGGLVFDTSAILVTNIPYIVLMLLPFHKETNAYNKICRWVFVIINGLALALNLIDAVYFRYTMRRTTTTVFQEFSNESNLFRIFFTEAFHNIILIMLFGLVAYAVYRYYVQPRLPQKGDNWWHLQWAKLLSLIALAPFVVAGIRGGFSTAVRPITISNANQYVDRPMEAALVLNTPFSLYRTIGKNVFVVPSYFDNDEEMAQVFTPIHPAVPDSMHRKNVVVLIVESFGR